MTRARSFIPALAFVTFGAATPVAQHWPHWRGPTHDGVSLETNLPVSWGAECKPGPQAAEPAPTSGASDQGSGLQPQRPRARPRSACRGPSARLDRLQGLRDRERRLEAAAAGLQRLDADHLGRHDLPERRRPRRTAATLELWASTATSGAVMWKRPLGGGNHMERKQNMSSPSPVTDGTARVGDDRHRHPQGVRLRRQRALGARHPEGLRPLRAATGATPRRRCCTATRSTCRCCTA